MAGVCLKCLLSLLLVGLTLADTDLWYSGAQYKADPSFKCPSEGFYGDDQQCHIFYRCIDEGTGLKAIRFECGPGTVFDTQNNICTHPWSSGRPECGGIEMNNEINEISGENVQSSTISTVIPSIQSSTISNVIPSSTTTTTEKPVSIDEPKENEIPRPIKSDNQVVPQRPSQNDCQKDGFMSDPKDCKKFFRCVENGNGFTKYEFSCADGTVWDDEVNSCNYPWATKRIGCGTSSAGSALATSTEDNNLYPGEGNYGYPDYNNQYPGGNYVDNNNNYGGYPDNNDLNPNPPVDPLSSTSIPDTGYGQPSQIQTTQRITSTEGTTQKVTTVVSTTAPPQPSTESQKDISTTTTQSQQTTETQKEISTSTTQPQQSTESQNDISTSTTQSQQSTESQKEISTPSTELLPPNVCTQDGFMGDSNDCQKFYRCVDDGKGSFTKYEFKCGDGTVWDDESNACNHAWAVKGKCGTAEPTNEIGTGQEESGTNLTSGTTEKTPDITTSGIAESSTLSTTSEIAFTSTLVTTVISTTASPQPSTESQKDISTPMQSQQTTEPQKEITISPTQPQQSTESQNDISTSTTLSQQSTESQKEISTPSTELLPPDVCTQDGFMGDSNDCQKFYRCVDDGKGSFTKYEFKCGDGTVWDHESNACNHAWAVKGKCGTAEPTNEIGTGQEEKVTESGTNLTSGTTEKTPEITTSGIAESSTLSTTSEIAITSTLYPSSTNEIPSTSSVSTDSSTPEQTTENQSTTNLQSTTGSTVTAAPTEFTKKPNNNCTSEGFISDSEDCRKFHRCVDNGNGGFTIYSFMCGEGTVWDQEIESCNYPYNVKNKCGNGIESTPTNNNSQATTESSLSQATTESTTTIVPNTSEHGESTTTGESSSSSEVTQSTEITSELPKEPTSTEITSEIPKETTSAEISSEPPKETTSSEITSEIPRETTSSEITSELPKEPTSTVMTTAAPLEPNNGEPSTTESSTTTITSSTGMNETTTEKTGTNSSTTCTKDGFISDPEDCKKFYRCVDNGKAGFTKYEFSCAEGTVWDQETESCNHPWAVNGNCKSETDVQDTGSTTEQSKESSESSTTDGSTTVSGISTSNSEPTTDGPTSSTTENGSTTSEISTSSTDGQAGSTTEQSTTEKGSTTSEASTINPASTTDGQTGSTTEPIKESSTTEMSTTSEIMLTTVSAPTTIGPIVESTTLSNQITESTSASVGVTSESQVTTTESTTSSSTEAEKQETTSTAQGTVSTTQGTVSTTQGTVSTTKKNPSQPVTCTKEGFMEDPTQNCNIFYRCVKNGNGGFTKYQFSCGEGTVWDQNIQSCNHAWATDRKCGNGAGASSNPPQSTESIYSSTTGLSSESTTQSLPSSTVESSKNESTPCDNTTETVKNNVTITCTAEGFYANPNDCKKFYRCVEQGNGRFSVYNFDCPPGTIFDPSISTCNYENSIYPPRDCSGANAVTPSTVEMTQTTTETLMTTENNEPTTNEIIESTTPNDLETTTDLATEKAEGTTEITTVETTETPVQTTETSVETTEIVTEASTTESSLTTETQTVSSIETTTNEATTNEATTNGATTEISETTPLPELTSVETTSVEATTPEISQTTLEFTTPLSEVETTSTETSTDTSTETSTDTSTEISTETSTETATETTETSSSCPKLEPNQISLVCPTGFRRHPQYCDLFYQCTMDPQTYNVKILVMRCPNDTMYDSKNIQCLAEDETEEQCNGELSQKASLRDVQLNYSPPPVEIQSVRKLCTGPGHYALVPGRCDSMYIKCEQNDSELRAYMYQCPYGFTYWPVSRKCERISPILNCGASTDFEKRWELPVAHI